ncbi:MAG: 16S rRNA (uracil(1498)-N(3))-methyltransferase [Candidatus Paceibacterota bacterium]|jgi:16S rRNA (uracil1498-N3)-methyltransferase
MRLHRFIGDWALGEEMTIRVVDTEVLSQVKNVLRLGRGDQIVLADGGGQEALVTIADFGHGYFDTKVEEYRPAKTESEAETTLFCAVLKKENFEVVVQKATELGVKKIVPIITERTVKLGLRFDRLEKIAREASEQSGRGVVPALSEPVEFSLALANLPTGTKTIVLEETGQDFSTDIWNQAKSRAIFVGPEGGWTEAEINQAKARGIDLVKVCNFTLRAETAAVVASFLLGHEN